MAPGTPTPNGLSGKMKPIVWQALIGCARRGLQENVYRHFRRLSRGEAEQLASKKSLSLQDQQNYSLAEIFFGNSVSPTAIPRPKVGFTQ
jgi:hypothetical protein